MLLLSPFHYWKNFSHKQIISQSTWLYNLLINNSFPKLQVKKNITMQTLFFSVAKTTNDFKTLFDQLVCLKFDLIKNLKNSSF